MDSYGTRIDTIVEKERGEAAKINMKILQLWLKGEGRFDRTWGGLINVLRNPCRLNALANEIEEVVGEYIT